MKDTLDLVFARVPTPPGQLTHEYEIFDGHRLVPIWEYLLRASAARSDPAQPADAMAERGAVRQSRRRRAAAVEVGTATANSDQRYYFSAPYHSWHGSASMQDSHIPLIVARKDYPGAKLKKLVDAIAGDEPSQLALVPIVRSLLLSEPPRRSRRAAG